MTKLLAAALLVIATAGVQAGASTAARAAFPGANGRIYFVDASDDDSEIYSMNPAGSQITKLTDNPFRDDFPAVSADGRTVVFGSDRSGTYQLWTMNADGTGATQLTTAGVEPNFFPFWSFMPTGQVVYSDPLQNLTLINQDGSGATSLGVTGVYPSASPDGSKIAFARTVGNFLELWTINSNGTGLAQVVDSSAAGYESFFPDWSPDGTQIVFAAAPFSGYAIGVVNADGTNPHLVISGPSLMSANWSPDGTKIEYIDDLSATLNVANPDGTAAQAIYSSGGLHTESDWAPSSSGPALSFAGFFQPVDNLPTYNQMNAGRAVPIKFLVGGDQGLNIFASGYPQSGTIICDSGQLIDNVEETVSAGSSSLQFDAATGIYSYTWKTDKLWKNTCRQFVMKLTDGTYHRANFHFS